MGERIRWWDGILVLLPFVGVPFGAAASVAKSELLPIRAVTRGPRHPSFLQVQRSSLQGPTQPLLYETRLFMTSLKMGDGSYLNALVDTGSGNLVVPSSACSSDGCKDHQRFQPEGDHGGHFLGSGFDDINMDYSTGHLTGSGFEGQVCFGDVCGSMSFIVAATESDDFAHYKFDAVLGLGPKQQAFAEGFSFIDAFAQQGALQAQTFSLELRDGEGSLELAVPGAPTGAASTWPDSTMLSASNASDSSSGANASVFAATFAATGVTQWLPVDGRHGEWALPMQDVTFGDEVLEAFGADGCRAVLDSGCGGIVLPAEVAQRVKSKLDISDCSTIGNLPPLGFVFNGRKYSVGPERYVEISKVDSSHCRLLIYEQPNGIENSAILGLPFLFDRRTVFDVGAMMVGIE